MQRTAPVSLTVLLVVMLGWLTPASAEDNPEHPHEWRHWGHDSGGARHSPLDQINKVNVSRLQKSWSYRTGELTLIQKYAKGRLPGFQSTPLVIGGVLYISTPSSRVIAVNATTGKEQWVFDPQKGSGEKRKFFSHRGVAYWEGRADRPGPARRILYGTVNAELICLDAGTGEPCEDFGEKGRVDLRKGVAEKWENQNYIVTSPPAVFKDLVIVGALVPEAPGLGPSGDVRAFSVFTGREVWRFHTVPRPGEPGNDTWANDSWKDRTGANVWSIMSVDLERGLVFLPTGSAAYDFYGADRVGDNLFANSVVALRAETGQRVWHYQLVHHDTWDYDLPAQPLLTTITREGKQIDVVVQVTKMGLVFVLNRETGEPVFPVEERVVPASPVPGEVTSPTQPFPVKPPPLSRNTAIQREDITDVTPESRERCLEIFEQAVNHGGVFMPAGLELTLSFPGTLGGATWSGASFDPASGYLFVNVNEVGRIGQMESAGDDFPLEYRRNSPWGAYARFWDGELPCQKPPWGTLNAVDLNTGDLAWQVPLGSILTLEEKGISGTGTPNLGGTITTAGGLVFVGGANDRKFRAFDVETGKVLWSGQLDGSGHATPVTYLGQDGRQYVAIAAGGGGYFSQDKVSDELAAFALPSE